MRSRIEYIKALMIYHINYYQDGGFHTIFSLQQKMLELGLCPKCGIASRTWCSNTGHFPCSTCGFKITENELNKVLDYDGRTSDKMMKSIMKRRLKQVRLIKKGCKKK